MLAPTEENQRIDSVYYITFAKPMEVQAILYSKGMPYAENFDDLYSMIVKLRDMYPDEINQKLFAIHPDKEEILAVAPKKHLSLCGLCKSNFTADELTQYKLDESKKTPAQLQNDFESLTAKLVTACHGEGLDQATIDGLKQKISILTELLNTPVSAPGATSTVTSTVSSITEKIKNFSISNLSTTEKVIGATAILGITGLIIYKIVKK